MFFIASNQDKAGVNIGKFLEKLGHEVHYVEIHPIYLDFFENRFNIPDRETVVFLSKHSSAKGVSSLTVHSAGNFSTNDLGGIPNFLTYTDPFLLHSILLNLNNLNKSNYSVTLEATHHGPASNKRLIFVEIGSSDQEYTDEYAGKTVAQAINDSYPEYGDSFCGIGGTHYSEKFTKMAIKEGIKFGHIASKYRFDELTEDILMQMYKKTENCKGFIIDAKSFNSEQKNKLKEKLENLGLPYEFR